MIDQTLSGEEFNTLYKGKVFVKLTNKKRTITGSNSRLD
jgi:hypothetical protein